MAIILNDNIRVSAPKATDYKYGPWNSISDAQTNVESAFRFQGLTQGILVDGAIVEHYYRDGITNAQLIPKSYTTSEANTTYLDPVTCVFDDSGTSLPAATTTAIDGVTIVDADRVLVLDSATAGEIGKIYSAAVSGTAITWTEETGGAGTGGDIGDTTIVYDGSSTYKSKRYTWDGSSWNLPGYSGSSVPITSIYDSGYSNLGASSVTLTYDNNAGGALIKEIKLKSLDQTCEITPAGGSLHEMWVYINTSGNSYILTINASPINGVVPNFDDSSAGLLHMIRFYRKSGGYVYDYILDES